MRSGIILLDKPAGMTSFDCIRVLKRSLKRTDLGHGGTLDKFATGLLPVLVGDGLKLVRFFLESFPTLPTYWKTYTGTFEFGRSTTTADPEGDTLETREVSGLTVMAVNEAMKSFLGAPYEQMPPRYSAKKIGGERASDLARKGEEPELKTASVTIQSFVCLGVDGPFVSFKVTCSKGCYVRSLAEDLARKMGNVAYTKVLRREAVGAFTLAQSVTLEALETQGNEAVLDMAEATSFLGKFPTMGAEREQLRVGQFSSIAARLANSGFSAGVYCAVYEDGAPAALLELTIDKRVNFLRAFQF